MKFLFVSYDGLINDIAWHVATEGHQVKYFIKNKDARDIADGFVPKSDNWRADADWADVIVFDDVLGHGKLAAELRKKGNASSAGPSTPTGSRMTAPSARKNSRNTA